MGSGLRYGTPEPGQVLLDRSHLGIAGHAVCAKVGLGTAVGRLDDRTNQPPQAPVARLLVSVLWGVMELSNCLGDLPLYKDLQIFTHWRWAPHFAADLMCCTLPCKELQNPSKWCEILNSQNSLKILPARVLSVEIISPCRGLCHCGSCSAPWSMP